MKKNNLKIEELVTFKEVAESGSIMNASRKLGIQFSTANYQIKKVEEYFDTILFDRTATGVKLNDEGLRIYQMTDKILDLLEEARGEIDESRNYIRVKMGEIPSILLLKDFLKKMQELHPELNLEIKSTNYKECIKDVNTGNVDVAIVGEACMNSVSENGSDRNLADHDATTLCSDGFILITPRDHPLSDKKVTSLSDLLKYTMISLPPEYGVEMSIRKELKKFPIDLDKKTKRIVVENLNQQINMVATGVGIAITSRRVGELLEKMGQVNSIPIEDLDADRKLYVVFSRYFKNNALKSDIISTLLDCVN